MPSPGIADSEYQAVGDATRLGEFERAEDGARCEETAESRSANRASRSIDLCRSAGNAYGRRRCKRSASAGGKRPQRSQAGALSRLRIGRDAAAGRGRDCGIFKRCFTQGRLGIRPVSPAALCNRRVVGLRPIDSSGLTRFRADRLYEESDVKATKSALTHNARLAAAETCKPNCTP